jgi:hypothetical protein
MQRTPTSEPVTVSNHIGSHAQLSLMDELMLAPDRRCCRKQQLIVSFACIVTNATHCLRAPRLIFQSAVLKLSKLILMLVIAHENMAASTLVVSPPLAAALLVWSPLYKYILNVHRLVHFSAVGKPAA